MSRGIGSTQRLALLALWQTRAEPEERDAGIPLTELKRRISSDRANARRAIRNLTRRGMVEEIAEDGERRVKLTSGAHFAMALTEALEERLPALGDVPSRPFDLAGIFDYAEDEGDSDPLESANTPCVSDVGIESAVIDNGGDPMQGRKPHGSAPSSGERAVSDNDRGAMQAGISHANEVKPCK